jgi:hypothetical protein
MFDGHAAIEVAHKESRSIEHARQLKVTWSDGQHMLVRLDEGLGFLESSARFDISRRPEDQARTLATLAFNLTRLRPQLATYLYVQDV